MKNIIRNIAVEAAYKPRNVAYPSVEETTKGNAQDILISGKLASLRYISEGGRLQPGEG